jgi:hypothetical protein
LRLQKISGGRGRCSERVARPAPHQRGGPWHEAILHVARIARQAPAPLRRSPPSKRRTPARSNAWRQSKPRRILYIADAQDIEKRAEHLQQVLGAVLDYVGAIVTDTSHGAPGGSIDREYLQGLIPTRRTMGRVYRSLLTWLLVDPFPDPDARTTSVLIDELDARLLKSRRYLVSGVSSAAQGTVLSLKSFDGGDRYVCGRRQLVLRPTQKRASSLNLTN